LIVTVKVHVELPHVFVAVHVTVVVPVANVEPDNGEQPTVVPPPVAVGSVHVATWLLHRVTSAGQAPITGVSLIVTVKVHVELPHVLVAVHVTVVVPVANVEPDEGEQATVGVGVPVAVGSVHTAM
jgi:hypothetical protein